MLPAPKFEFPFALTFYSHRFCNFGQAHLNTDIQDQAIKYIHFFSHGFSTENRYAYLLLFQAHKICFANGYLNFSSMSTFAFNSAKGKVAVRLMNFRQIL
jgi:hypothetical protein